MRYLFTPNKAVYHLCEVAPHGLTRCVCGMGTIMEDVILDSYKGKKKLCKNCKRALDNRFLEDI